MNTVKDAISRAVDRLADELEALSIKIHDQPELAYQEVQACAWLCEFLGKQGFKVEPGAGGVETAFRATIETGEGPTVAILCEYDALPGIGHACGHNVIATSGAGAGAALAAVRTQLPKGRIHVIGTPAEEGGGGKIKLINAGLFKDVDAAMLLQQVRPDCRIHGIITSGGAAANIIPEYASATFYVRAPRIDTMWDLYRRVVA